MTDLLSAASVPAASAFDSFGGAFEFIFSEREPEGVIGDRVGGLGQVFDLMLKHIEISLIALAISILLAFPLGVWLGHRGRGEWLAIAIGNAGRAIPELALIAFMVAFIGFGMFNLVIALMILGIPPILINAFVGIRGVDRGVVEAARGMGMTELSIITRVEMPLAVPTMMSGIRTAAIAIVATATIAPLAGVLTLGDFIINFNVYGNEGVLAGAILVALLALSIEAILAGLQRLLTPRGLAVREEKPEAGAMKRRLPA